MAHECVGGLGVCHDHPRWAVVRDNLSFTGNNAQWTITCPADVNHVTGITWRIALNFAQEAAKMYDCRPGVCDTENYDDV